MIYLLDTSVVSRMMRRDDAVRRRVEALAEDDTITISAITRGEILYGIKRLPHGKRRDGLLAEAERQFASMGCESVSTDCAAHYARVKRDAERAGTPLDENDLWIAATAFALGATLAVADSDFERLGDALVENWLA